MLPLIDNLRLVSTKEWLVQCSRMEHLKLKNYLTWSDVFPFYLGSIWLTRNDHLFNNKRKPIPTNLAHERAIKFKLLARKNRTIRNKLDSNHCWIPSDEELKLNVDGSFDSELKC